MERELHHFRDEGGNLPGKSLCCWPSWNSFQVQEQDILEHHLHCFHALLECLPGSLCVECEAGLEGPCCSNAAGHPSSYMPIATLLLGWLLLMWWSWHRTTSVLIVPGHITDNYPRRLMYQSHEVASYLWEAVELHLDRFGLHRLENQNKPPNHSPPTTRGSDRD